METLDADTSANESRTKRYIAHKCKFLSIAIIAIAIIVVPLNAADSIDFDNADTLWFKEAIITPVPINQTGYNNTVPLIKIQNLKAIDADDQIRVKPTFSDADCANDEPDLQIVNSIFEPPTGTHSNGDLIVALNNFEYKLNVNVYLCIKSKYEKDFQHMGANSKFST